VIDDHPLNKKQGKGDKYLKLTVRMRAKFLALIIFQHLQRKYFTPHYLKHTRPHCT